MNGRRLHHCLLAWVGCVDLAHALGTEVDRSGDALGGFALLLGFAVICFLVVNWIRGRTKSKRRQLDDPKGDAALKVGTSISRPIDER